jgi:hypothetical protein
MTDSLQLLKHISVPFPTIGYFMNQLQTSKEAIPKLAISGGDMSAEAESEG